MIKDGGGRPRAGQTSALIAEAEGLLLAQAHVGDAHREARELCAAMPWLTSTEAEEITRHYVERRLDVTRHLLRSTARRADDLRQEYETRYRVLRRDLLRRHAACASAVLACATGLGAAVAVLCR